VRHSLPPTFSGLVAKLARILRARYLIVLVCLAGAVAGGILVIATSPKLYMGRARVVLDLVKLDEQTGTPLSKDFAEPYVESQLHLLKDAETTSRVAEELGWLDNPDYVAQYGSRPANDDRDIRTWAGDQLSSAISGNLLPDSNVLEITYRAYSPEAARIVVDAVRRAFVEEGLSALRETSKRQEDWFDGQADIIRKQIESLVSRREQLQRDTGVVLQDDTTDLETAKLDRLNRIPQMPFVARAPAAPFGTGKLMELDTEIAQLKGTAGPNNPKLMELLRRRSVIAAQVDAERRANDAGFAQAIAAAQAAAVDVQLQRQKVGNQAEAIAALHQIQDQIKVLSALYEKVTARADDLRQSSDVAETERMPVGSAEVEDTPYFPNPTLIIGGTAAFGGALGVTLALFAELLSRRVRGATDLAAATDAPVLGSIRLDRVPAKPRRRRRFRVPRLAKGVTAAARSR
jgi:uncharacterized protein involved in exopolysaccharide biosynthesis